MIRFASLAAAAFSLLAPAISHAGDLGGTVRDAAANPVAGARVSLPALEIAVTTDAQGAYRFEGLEAGEHSIAVELPGGMRQHTRAQVTETGETRRYIFLYSRTALSHARDGIDPVEAMLAEALMAQAWDAASAMTAAAQSRETRIVPDLAG